MSERIRVGTREEVEQRGILVVKTPHGRIAVVADGGELFAVDNRCPHMGFPLDRGSVRDGILTCDWHHARFDLRSGCTFDLFADDVPRYRTEVEDGVVWVDPTPVEAQDADYHLRRLRRGIEQEVPLVQAKSLLGLVEGGATREAIVGEVVPYASRNLSDFSEGLVRPACVANLYPHLSRETAYQALLYAIRRIATEANRSVPRRERQPLAAPDHETEVLDRWLRQWVTTRHRDAAERTLLTGLHRGLPPRDVAQLLFSAADERMFANGGHLFDFSNKAFELVELLGWPTANEVLPLLVGQLTQSRGAEESTEWHHPIEIVEPLRDAFAGIPELLERGREQEWKDDPPLVDVLLGDDPIAIIDALSNALAAGAAPAELSRRVAYAAALRLARFATSNEVTDWQSCQHTMNHANAAHQAIRRSPTADVVRAVFQAAIAVYMDRYLNVPPARLPSERGRGDPLPDGAGALRQALLDALDQRGGIETAARIVSHYLRQSHPVSDLIDTLTLATVREDLDFHTLQVLDACVRQYFEWEGGLEAENVLVGAVRSLAAQCPTRRAGQQTAMIALRLHRGDNVFEEAQASESPSP